MKKTKIIITCIAIITAMGATLAFKANKFLNRNVYTLLFDFKNTTINVGGVIYSTTIPNCILTNMRSTNSGPQINVSSTTTHPFVVTEFTAKDPAGIVHTVTTTYPYCTLWFTRVVESD